jgi:hypothetical protein
LAEGDKNRIVFYPVTPGQDPAQRLFAFVWRSRLDETKAIRDTVDVRIDAYTGLAKGVGDHQIGGLAANAPQSQQILDSIWNLAFEALKQLSTDLQDDAGFGPIEAHWINQSSDPRWRQFKHFRWRVSAGEKTFSSLRRRLILRS